MKIEYIQKCKCGAVTIRFDNSASNSMFWETFEKLDLDTGDAYASVMEDSQGYV